MREVRVHRRGEGRLPGPAAVPDAPGVARGLLRLARAPAGAPGAGGRTVGSRDRGDPCREPAALRQPADSRGAGGPRLPHGEEARGAPDAGPRVGRPAPAAIPGDDALAARLARRGEPLGAAVRTGGTQPGVGHRHHLHSHGRGLALRSGDPRSLLALRRGLGDERPHHGRSDSRRPRSGVGPPAPAAGATAGTTPSPRASSRRSRSSWSTTRPGPLGRRRAPSSSITWSASTMGGGGIRRLATSVPERSSSGATTKHWQPNPGVYETGASPHRGMYSLENLPRLLVVAVTWDQIDSLLI